MPISIRAIDAAQTHGLRGIVLRPNSSPDQLIYAGDDAPDTFHLGAFGRDELVGIASIYRESWPRESWPRDASPKAYRLRGMAVDSRFVRRGIGAALVRRCLLQIGARGGELLWCNARTSASNFYRALGFESVGEEFEIAGIGPHFLMRCDVPRLEDSVGQSYAMTDNTC